jgi:hypothetical protein
MNKYGPNTPQVELFIERLKVLTDEEVKRIAAWDVARIAARDATWDAARIPAWNTAWNTVRDATWNTTWDAAWKTAWAAQAIVVMDLITEEQFTILTKPFAEILVELGIVWERK